MATQNTNGINALNAGSVICPTIKEANYLNWTVNKSQPYYPTKYGSFVYSNRAVEKKGEEYFVTAKNGDKVKVRKTGENRYEVQL